MNIVAYGSLMNQKSLERTLKRSTELYKITIPGYQRIFNAVFDEYAFLNIVEDKNSTIEAAYFTLENEELEKFKEREANSLVTEVVPGYFAFVWPSEWSKELPVLQTYIDVCEEGAKAFGINFWKGTKRPKVIVNDREKPLYP